MTANILKLKGLSVAVLHSGLSMIKRNEELEEFQSGRRALALATNVLARGISIENVQVVINFELPYHQTKEDVDLKRYLYRIGRSRNFDREGLAINLVSHGEENMIDRLIAEYPELIEITI